MRQGEFCVFQSYSLDPFVVVLGGDVVVSFLLPLSLYKAATRDILDTCFNLNESYRPIRTSARVCNSS